MKNMNKLFTELLALMILFTAGMVSAAAESPTALLERTSKEVFEVIEKDRERLNSEPDRIYQIVDQYIIPHLDDVTMAKLALGKNWRKASNDQKISFVDEFRELLVRTYSKSLEEFRDQKINFMPVIPQEGEDRIVVRSEVIQPGGPSIPVDYRMRLKDGSWKVYDIYIEGVSLVTSYRGTFAQEVRKSGMEGLLAMLREKNKRPGS